MVFAYRVRNEIESARQGGARTTQEIADHLNERGIPTRRGGPWYRSTVSRVLQRHKVLAEHSPVVDTPVAEPEPPAERPPYVPRVVRRKIV